METIMNENNQQQKEVEMEELQQLLKDVYEATKDIKQGEKEPFNVFELCGVWSTEMRHSAILRELLDPQGMHGFKTKFLEAFFKQIGLEFNPNGCRAKTEVACSNGRMDIVISSGDMALVIENKIYASDQEKQLERYSDWLNDQKKHNKELNTALLYLTLDGHEASNAKNIDYQRISYRNDILQWLDKCIEEIFKNSFFAKDNKTNPFAKSKIDERNAFVKKLLLQYKELIQNLTGMDMDPEMKNKISGVITSNEENYLAAVYIAQTFNDCHQRIIQEIAEECKGDMICKMERPDTDGRIGFSYTLKEDQQYKLLFEFQKGNYKELCYGLHLNDTTELPKDFLNIKISFKCIAGMGLTFQEGNKDVCDSPNKEGWFFAIKADPDSRDWAAETFAKRWEKEDESAIKKIYQDKIKKYLDILTKIIKENQEILDETLSTIIFSPKQDPCLPGEHMNPFMKDAVTSATTANAQNYLAAALTAKAFDGIHQEIVRKIAVACTPEGMKYDVSHCTSARFASFAYSFNTEKQYKLLFEFQQGNYHALYYGLHDLTNKNNAPHPYNNAQITINRPNGFDGPNEHGWIAGAYANTDFQNWDAESLLQHWDNDFADIKENIKGYIANLMEIIKNNPALDDEKYK